MATHTQIGGMTIDAFQWLGGTMAAANLPTWTEVVALQTPGDGTLDVPTSWGTFKAGINDWVIHYPTGDIGTMSNTLFTALYV